ncbi:hypothetical protein [Enterococcus sp. AZ126]|uniref:hypothetical protein n=1 Tax=Enterococcus sp. AZ126 TaxID=2774635 RepID=UPI003F682AC2
MQKNLGKETTDTVTQADLNSITYVNISSSNIYSLEGAQYLDRVKAFHAYDNNIKSLIPLSEWQPKNLQNLQLRFNPISDVKPLINIKKYRPDIWNLDLTDTNLDNADMLDIIQLPSANQMFAFGSNKIDDFSLLRYANFWKCQNSAWVNNQDWHNNLNLIELAPIIYFTNCPRSVTVLNKSKNIDGKPMKISNISHNGKASEDNSSVTWDSIEGRPDFLSFEYYETTTERLEGINYNQPFKYGGSYKIPIFYVD